MMNSYKRILKETQAKNARQDIDAYLAGFFDGEGHITISRDSRREWSCYVEIGATQISREPLEILVRSYGGKIHVKHSKNLCHVWRCNGKDAMYALYRMLPWLTVKSKKARAALVVLQHRPLSISGGQISSRQKTAITKALKGLHVVSREDVKQ